MDKIRIGIVGYGNIGRGVEKAIARNEDMELTAVFTRRDPSGVKIATEGVEVKHIDDMLSMKDKIDVMMLCGGSATDLPVMGPQIVQNFNTIDSFDTHARIPEYFANVDKAAKSGGHVGIISVGWDPGMFSLNRLYAESILVQGSTYTFWGKGVSQGHSDAIRRVEGVKNAIQYTVPVEDAVERVRSGSEPQLTTRDKHLRECYVVPEEGADLKKIEETIKTMPNYFDDYDTTVTFITEEELKENHSKMPHGGFVIRSGETGTDGSKHIIEYSLKLDSNPEFTASVLVCYARAAYRLAKASLNRLYAESILVQGSTYTFWGKGVSQGHSDAIRRVEGVKNAIQYTVPVEDAVERVRSGSEPQLTTRDKHLRECYVVPEEGADLKKIEETIKTMPNYFDDYDTTVTFITEEELKENHSKMPHGGFVIRSGETGTDGSKHIIEYSLKLDSNPEFTASVLVCYARAAYRLAKAGETGAKTVFDIAPALLSMKTPEQLRAELL